MHFPQRTAEYFAITFQRRTIDVVIPLFIYSFISRYKNWTSDNRAAMKETETRLQFRKTTDEFIPRSVSICFAAN